MKNNHKYIIACAILSLGACKPNLKTTEVTKGSADFTTYVAMGNSLCAGYTDGGLSYEGQQNSFPRMLAQQFALAGGGEFKTPYMNAAGNGNDGSGNPIYKLVMVNGAPAPAQIGTATPISDNVSAAGLYNHLGIPGIKSIEADIALYGQFNPFLTRLSATPGSVSLLGLAVAKKPTFFTYWLGANDVLGWATGGGTGNVITTPFQVSLVNYASTIGALIHPLMVAGNISAQIDSLTKNGAKGAIANVPDVASTPYFTTVPYNAVVLTRQGQVDSLNGGYIPINAALTGDAKIVWKLGANPIVIVDSTIPFVFLRKATSEDLICLTAAGPLRLGAGSASPLTDNYVLDKTEVALARNYTNQYNTEIAKIANAKGLALVDANIFLKTFQSGLVYNNVAIGPKFATGGGFGLDGVHPTPRGYALIANLFLDAINAKYGSNIPRVEVSKYRGVPLP
jgi:GDSL-like Lipase/Acylhydrolase